MTRHNVLNTPAFLFKKEESIHIKTWNFLIHDARKDQICAFYTALYFLVVN